MLILIDRKIPDLAKKRLAVLGELLELATSGVTYEAISGHPDIFFCQVGSSLVVAPNLPEDYLKKLYRSGIPFTMGQHPVGQAYPATARYNAVVSEGMLIHHLDLTDPAVMDKVEPSQCIHVNQGYCRCNLLPLEGHAFLTSDQGIHRALTGKGFRVLYVDPAGIRLPGYPHGFFGGVCGILGDRVFFVGSLDHHAQGSDIRSFLYSHGYEVIELCGGPLLDGGGILFI